MGDVDFPAIHHAVDDRQMAVFQLSGVAEDENRAALGLLTPRVIVFRRLIPPGVGVAAHLDSRDLAGVGDALDGFGDLVIFSIGAGALGGRGTAGQNKQKREHSQRVLPETHIFYRVFYRRSRFHHSLTFLIWLLLRRKRAGRQPVWPSRL